MVVDLNTPIAYFSFVFDTVVAWLMGVEWVIGVVHFSLFELIISVVVFEMIVWFIKMILWVNGE